MAKGGEEIEVTKKIEVGTPVSYLYSLPVFPSRNGVSTTINRLLSQCLSQCTLPFASVGLTVMESFGVMDASGVRFYPLLPLYLCLHPPTAEMSACTFSIACECGYWGYGQCKCTIWHHESEVERAGGIGLGKEIVCHTLPLIQHLHRVGWPLGNWLYVLWINITHENKITDSLFINVYLWGICALFLTHCTGLCCRWIQLPLQKRLVSIALYLRTLHFLSQTEQHA